ncbi:chloroplast sensor kinase [Striga asiatica]|uniref:Chloroplast sensor kinase n=1 Tax=Striga asiatica TaxID=4170 RepID=A0A5A7NY04_STRAF|nr:chloroplast sensor kinase [Striga asiatica]
MRVPSLFKLEDSDQYFLVHASRHIPFVYVRPAGSYVMDRLELRCITSHPGGQAADIVVLIGNFSMPAGLRVAEASISRQQAEFFPELGAVVLPMVTHPFIVGFLVAEFPKAVDRDWHGMKDSSVSGKSLPLPHSMDPQSLDVQTYKDYSVNMPKFSAEQKLNAINITHSLALAYVMDQKTMLLQQSSWQNNVRMSNLVEQIQGSLSSIRTLTNMLSVLLKRSEVSYDIAQDIEVQGEHMRDTLQQLQDAVYLTKVFFLLPSKNEINGLKKDCYELVGKDQHLLANIVRYNNETLRKMQQSYDEQPEVTSPISSNTSMETFISKMQDTGNQLSLSSRSNNDSEFPMPPLALAPSHQQQISFGIHPSSWKEKSVGNEIKKLNACFAVSFSYEPSFCRRPCEVSELLQDLVGAIKPLACKQRRIVELCNLSMSLKVAVEESALRQALSNLIEGALLRTEVGGRIEIISTRAPAGGALIIIDDDGPDMHYMLASDPLPICVIVANVPFVPGVSIETQMHSLVPFGADLCAEDHIEDNMAWNFVAGLTVAREILESYGCVVRVISPRNSEAVLGVGGTRLEIWLPSMDADDCVVQEA